MTIPQPHALIQNNIHLDVQPVSAVVRLQRLDLLDRLGEAHRQVQQHVAIVRGGGSAGEVADVLRRGTCPLRDHEKGEEEAAERVEVPDLEVVAD